MKTSNKRLPGQLRIAGITLLLALVETNSAVAMKYKDNTIKIKSGTHLNFTFNSATFVLTDFSVTSNQDPFNEIYKGLVNNFNLTSNIGEITYKIGRQKSYEVAGWFNTNVPSYKTTVNNSPGELNFAFLGTLSLTVSGGQYNDEPTLIPFEDIGLAQGRTYASNNWWFGGKNCEHDLSDNSVTCLSAQAHWAAKFQLSGNTISLLNVIPINEDYDEHDLQRCKGCPP
ncbi:MAG: hypothetical protein HRT38_04530 [Alteromonadaceae bacterium]|nr:hypothetical protein [Alteromonadaceae bacterium]